MPELPEVEVIKRGLQGLLPGRRVIGIVMGRKKLRYPMPRRNLTRYILNSRIKTVARRAKYLLIIMDSGATLIVHLGMTGRLGVFPEGGPAAKHDHLRLKLDNAMQLRFNDTRRFGFIRVVEPGMDLSSALPADLGPEPLGPDFTPRYLLKKAAGRKKPLKNFLMDNRVVVGIGNIYACEALFQAGINPEKRTGDLTLEEWTRVVDSCRAVLQQAIDSGGTSISDFVNESGRAGYFQLKLQVYARQGQPCRACASPIIRKTMAGRATFFCPACQK
jgi:formamidopyrimidine-DNA glycosylase